VCPSVSPSVRPSVRHTPVCIKTAKYKIMQKGHTITQRLYFSDDKDLGEIQTGSQMQVRQVKIGDV